MLLYDVFYFGNSFDMNIPLPSISELKKLTHIEVKYAVCKNWEEEYLIPGDNEWIRVSEKEALNR